MTFPLPSPKSWDGSGVIIKVCGLTRPEDVELCLELGVDWLGFVLEPETPRALTIETAQALAKQVDHRAVCCAVFGVLRSLDGLEAFDLVQYRSDPNGRAPQLGDRALPALTPADCAGEEVPEQFVLEPQVPGAWGGTGVQIDLSTALEVRKRFPSSQLILAGGLRPDNVAEAIRSVHPDGVDVSSGVEDKPRIKSAERLADFVDQVRKAELEAKKGRER